MDSPVEQLMTKWDYEGPSLHHGAGYCGIPQGESLTCLLPTNHVEQREVNIEIKPTAYTFASFLQNYRGIMYNIHINSETN